MIVSFGVDGVSPLISYISQHTHPHYTSFTTQSYTNVHLIILIFFDI